MRPQSRRTRRHWSWWATAGLCVVAAALIVTYAALQIWRPRHDLVIRDAVIHDGSGGPAFHGTIVVDGDRITEIRRGRFHVFLTGRTTIYAHGLDVAPGFIDTHTHVDQSILESSAPIRANNFIGQGVTTIVTGNCGRSPVDIARFRKTIEVRGTNVNIATLVGLNSVRSAIMKTSTAPASGAETARMCALVAAAMRDGAAGVSTGAAYVPGRFASQEETIAQLAVAGRHGGIFATHLRDEGNGIIQSVAEAIRQSTRAHVPLLISHFKIVGPANCGKYAEVERMLARAGRQGLRVYADQYPYTASSSNLDLYLPDWYLAMSGAARRALLQTNEGKARLGRELRERVVSEGFHDFGFAYVASYQKEMSLAGLSVAEIARVKHLATSDPQVETIADLLREGGAQMVYQNICTATLPPIASRPTTMFGSDSAIRYEADGYRPHPRGWGTFPRVIAQYVRRDGVLSLDEAVRKMTSLPARTFGLDHRGLIRPGYYADLVVFDAKTITDRATYTNPFLRPRGIVHVVVNGTVSVTEPSPGKQRILPVAAGRFLRPARPTQSSAM